VATILLVSLLLPWTIFAKPERVGPVTAELIARQQAIQPGQPIELGLHIVPDPEWHVYWRNPGDAGMPPKLTWQLPP
jgi:thiol:disulfide interchange protein DsbD